MPSSDWPGYLDAFHRRHAGITEDSMGRATAGGGDPYDWLVDPLRGGGPVLDLACGSGPLIGRLVGTPWVGLDRSDAELTRFTARRSGRAVRGDAARLPFGPATFSTVICSMAVMVLQPLGGVLAEVRRVLTPDGEGALLLPDRFPLTVRDLVRYGRLMVSLRRTHLTYPNDNSTALPMLLDHAGLRVSSDQRRRFALPLTTAQDSRTFVESFYLPGCPPERIDAASRAARRWVGDDIGIPLRRMVFTSR